MAVTPAITDLDQLKDKPVVAALLAWKSAAVQGAKFDRDELTIYVVRESLPAACEQLKNSGLVDFLSDLTCADYHPGEPRFEVAYHLLSMKRKDRLRLKLRLEGGDPQVESITSLRPSAGFFDRQPFVLFVLRLPSTPD